MANDIAIIGKFVIRGHLISLHMRPGGGKTLISMYEIGQSIEKGILEGKNVFYFNYDDSGVGFLDKVELAAQLGFQMYGPNDLKIEDVKQNLEQMIGDGSCAEAVVIIDTLKKFVDVMCKKEQKPFYDLLRKFCMAGGTVLLLAHTNKHADADGNSIAAGTQDIMDDCDEQIIAEKAEGVKSTVTKFVMAKSRSNIPTNIYYRFGSVKDKSNLDDDGNHINLYPQLLKTVVEVASEDGVVEADMLNRETSSRTNAHLIDCIRWAIRSGHVMKSHIVTLVNSQCGYGKRKIDNVLTLHTATSFAQNNANHNFYWTMKRGENNACLYTLLG